MSAPARPLRAPAAARLSGLALLMTSCALAGLALGGTAARAQDVTTDTAKATADTQAKTAGGTATLAPITVTATGSDATSIVADETSSGSMMPTDVLDNAASVSVVTEAEITRRKAATVEQVLQYTAGASTDFYGTDDRFDYFNIRGFDAYTYRDGLLVGEYFGGVREEPYAFTRFEVLKGANSTGFGISDPGGALNMITKTPTGERLRDSYLTYGSNNHKEVGFDIGDRFDPAGVLSWRLTAKRQDAETEFDGSNDDETFVMAGLAWRPTDATTVSFTADHLERDGFSASSGYPFGVDFDRSTTFGEPDFNDLSTDRDSYTLKVDHDFGNGLSFGSVARYSKGQNGFNQVYVYDADGTGNTTIDRYMFASDKETEDFALNAHLMYDTSFGAVRSRSLVGFELRDTTVDAKGWYAYVDTIDYAAAFHPTGGVSRSDASLYQDKRTTTHSHAVFAQQELTYGRFIANLGLRHDWIGIDEYDKLGDTATSADYSETTARLGLTYKATDDLSIYGSYAESVVPPATLGDEPEMGKQYELGVKYRPAGMRALISAAVFDLRKYNTTVTDADNPTVERPVGEMRVRGFELEAKAEATDRLSFTAAYAHLDSKIVDSDGGTNNGNRIEHVPENALSIWVDYLLPGGERFGDTRIGLGARYEDGYYTAADNSYRTGAETLYDAAVSYQVAPGTELALNVTNLLDEKFIAQRGTGDYYNAGREVSLTLRRSW